MVFHKEVEQLNIIIIHNKKLMELLSWRSLLLFEELQVFFQAEFVFLRHQVTSGHNNLSIVVLV